MPSSTTERPLSALLQQEFYLLKILGHLVDDGLHECRRVCHRWKDACKKLPVKLSLVPRGDLPLMVETSPQAQSIIIAVSNQPQEEQVEEPADLDSDLDEAVFRHLVRLDNLGQLVFISRGEWMISDAVGERLASFQQLKNLTIDMSLSAEQAMSMCAAVDQLTQLTFLGFSFGKNRCPPGMQPFENLKDVEDLRVRPDLFINENGQLLFPCLTNLTALTMSTHYQFFPQYREGLLQVLRPYASSLQSLRIVAMTHGDWFEDMSLLTQFTKLQSLAVPKQDEENTNCFPVIKNMEQLTELDVNVFDAGYDTVVEAFSVLTGIRNLQLETEMGCMTALSFVSHLVQLSQLAVTCPIRIDIPDFAPGDDVFSISNVKFTLPARCAPDHTLSLLTQLEKLTLDNTVQKAGGSAFSHLTKLKELTLKVEDVEDDLFHALSTLPDLTQFNFGLYSNNHLRLLPHVTVISGLSKLIVSGAIPQPSPCSYLADGDMPHLRYLVVNFPELSVDDQMDLRRQFPCLRKMVYGA